MYVCMYVCMYVYVCTLCVCECMYVCMYVCTVCMYVLFQTSLILARCLEARIVRRLSISLYVFIHTYIQYIHKLKTISANVCMYCMY